MLACSSSAKTSGSVLTRFTKAVGTFAAHASAPTAERLALLKPRPRLNESQTGQTESLGVGFPNPALRNRVSSDLSRHDEVAVSVERRRLRNVFHGRLA